MRQPVPFGKYLLLDRVSVGGMAEVFKAKSYGVEGFEKILAIKRILPSMGEDRDFIKMFIDEAKIAGQLTHANICQIFELGRTEGSHFIAMEYIWGKDLLQMQNRLRRRKQSMPVAMAAFIVAKACEGLDYAHRKRDPLGRPLEIVHRDCSPQNVLISYEGEVKIIDFGIAKAASRSSRTMAGVLKGKFGYMSPEQVRGLPLDCRSDIFALGTILYECLTGVRLFQGETDFSTLEKVRNVDISPPRQANPDIPPEIEAVILRALARDVDERYQWCSEMQADLQHFLMTQQTVFTAKTLSIWLKEAFAPEIERERQQLENYKKIGRDGLIAGVPAAAAKLDVVQHMGPTGRADDPTVLGGPSFDDVIVDEEPLEPPELGPAPGSPASVGREPETFDEGGPTAIFGEIADALPQMAALLDALPKGRPATPAPAAESDGTPNVVVRQPTGAVSQEPPSLSAATLDLTPKRRPTPPASPVVAREPTAPVVRPPTDVGLAATAPRVAIGGMPPPGPLQAMPPDDVETLEGPSPLWPAVAATSGPVAAPPGSPNNAKTLLGVMAPTIPTAGQVAPPSMAPVGAFAPLSPSDAAQGTPSTFPAVPNTPYPRYPAVGQPGYPQHPGAISPTQAAADAMMSPGLAPYAYGSGPVQTGGVPITGGSPYGYDGYIAAVPQTGQTPANLAPSRGWTRDVVIGVAIAAAILGGMGIGWALLSGNDAPPAATASGSTVERSAPSVVPAALVDASPAEESGPEAGIAPVVVPLLGAEPGTADGTVDASVDEPAATAPDAAVVDAASRTADRDEPDEVPDEAHEAPDAGRPRRGDGSHRDGGRRSGSDDDDRPSTGNSEDGRRKQEGTRTSTTTVKPGGARTAPDSKPGTGDKMVSGPGRPVPASPKPEVPAASADTGFLLVSSTPWARVFVDGVDTGKTTDITGRRPLPLSAGKHKIKFVVGNESETFVVNIQAGKTTRFERNLQIGRGD